MVQKAPVHYKTRLAVDKSKNTVYPVWLSIPCCADHIDVLEVHIRTREKRTPSLFSSTSSISSEVSQAEPGGDPYGGALTLLYRFIERGVGFFGRRRSDQQRGSMTIGLLRLCIIEKDMPALKDPEQLFDKSVKDVDQILVGKEEDYEHFDDDADLRRMDEYIRVFADHVRTFGLQFDHNYAEWSMKDVARRRNECKERALIDISRRRSADVA